MTFGIGDNFVEPSSSATNCHNKEVSVSGIILMISDGTMFSFDFSRVILLDSNALDDIGVTVLSFDCSLFSLSSNGNGLCVLLFSVDVGHIVLSAIA